MGHAELVLCKYWWPCCSGPSGPTNRCQLTVGHLNKALLIHFCIFTGDTTALHTYDQFPRLPRHPGIFPMTPVHANDTCTSRMMANEAQIVSHSWFIDRKASLG